MAFQPGIDFGTLDVSCPECGGVMKYAGDRKSAACASCGHKRTLAGETEFVTPRALSEKVNLAAYPAWSAVYLTGHQCLSCKGKWMTAPNQALSPCPACGGDKWEPADWNGKIQEPSGLIPATVTAAGAKKKLSRYIGFHLLHPPELRKVPERLSLTYLPVWLVDGYVRSSWIAEVGFAYQQETAGKKEEKTLTEYLRGYLEKFFDRVEIPASSVAAAHMGLFPYPWEQAIKPQSVYFQQAWVEAYHVDGKAALEQAEKEMEKQMEIAVSNKIPGATFNDLELISEKSLLALRHILVPVWMAPFIQEGKTFRYLIHGVTGKVTGAKPLSSRRVALAIAGLIGILVIITLFVTAFFKG